MKVDIGKVHSEPADSRVFLRKEIGKKRNPSSSNLDLVRFLTGFGKTYEATKLRISFRVALLLLMPFLQYALDSRPLLAVGI